MTMPAEAPAAAPPAPEPETFSLHDALSGLEPPADEPEAQPEGEPAAPAEGTEQAPEPEKSDGEPPKTDDKEDFSDDRPWTPERVKSAAARAKELQRAAHDRWVKLEKREAKFGRRLTEYKQERDMVLAYREEQSAVAKQLASGDKDAAWDAFDRWSRRHGGMPGRELYEKFSLGLAGQKSDPRDAIIADLKQRLDGIENKDQQSKKYREQAESVFQARSSILSGAQNAAQYPELAKFAQKEGLAETCGAIEQGILSRYGSFGRHIDIGAVLAQAELALRNNPDLVGPSAALETPPAASGADAGRDTSVARPEVARRTPGKSVTPSLSTRSSDRTRPIEDGESTEELANDPDFLRQLGIPA